MSLGMLTRIEGSAGSPARGLRFTPQGKPRVKVPSTGFQKPSTLAALSSPDGLRTRRAAVYLRTVRAAAVSQPPRDRAVRAQRRVPGTRRRGDDGQAGPAGRAVR